MKFQVFAIYDQAAEAFMAPFYKPAIGMGVRDFTDMVNAPNNPINAHHADFSLYHLGSFDNCTLERENHTPPKLLGHAGDFLEQRDWVAQNEVDTNTPIQSNSSG